MSHWCTQCGETVERHPEKCERGCRHFPALCCAGCDCGSFEESAHDDDDEVPND